VTVLRAPPRILHLFSTFDAGGKELRAVRLINVFGREAEHWIAVGDPERRAAAAAIDRRSWVLWPPFPPLAGKPLPRRLLGIAAAMAGYDLICTYNWGAMDAVMAHTLFADVHKLPPLVHHEDGFNEDEAHGLKRGRNIFRRIALGRSSALVVPSRELERIALDTWHQPRWRVRLIPNGIDTRAFAATPKRDGIAGLVKRKGERWLGTLAGLRKVKDLPVLVRALATLPDHWQLVIAGEGPERAAIVAEAERLGLDHRVHLPGFVSAQKIAGLFDLFALSSRSEQFPISVVEAMAAGLSVVAPRVGDIAAMVASDNGPFLSDPGDEAALLDAIDRLAADDTARARIGAANRQKARAEYDETLMIGRYRTLYWKLMGLAE
jgi:glycosyltransferase involved in cell wall biosynthesis